MQPIRKWQTLTSRMVFEHKWCRVRQDTVRLANQQLIDDYFVVVRPDVVLVLAITPNQEVVFVQQYRHGVEEILLELPAGTFDPETESPEVAAQRELQEETGYRAEHLVKLATLHDNPVKDTNQIHLFLAQNAFVFAEQNLDMTEAIEVVLIPVEELSERIWNGEICVSGTIAALFLGMQFLKVSTPLVP
ncbi:NUDIX hydrolase [Trichocoleus sp. FACHB-262]|nr:NUDIX hydrolase [Trichocoleus sp. FACHB-262]